MMGPLLTPDILKRVGDVKLSVDSFDGELRRCTKCSVEYPATTEFFHRCSRVRSGLQPKCKACRRAYYEENRDAEIARALAWHGTNRAEHNQKMRMHYVSNQAQYACAGLAWRKANPVKVLAYQTNRRGRLRGASGRFTGVDMQIHYERQEGKCFYCGVELNGKWDNDHLIPPGERYGGSNEPENMCCACASCNRRKHHRDVEDYRSYLLSVGESSVFYGDSL